MFLIKVFAGDDSGGETPVSIPNTEVKPSCADGTDLETDWESRSSPVFFCLIFSFLLLISFFFVCEPLESASLPALRSEYLSLWYSSVRRRSFFINDYRSSVNIRSGGLSAGYVFPSGLSFSADFGIGAMDIMARRSSFPALKILKLNVLFIMSGDSVLSKAVYSKLSSAYTAANLSRYGNTAIDIDFTSIELSAELGAYLSRGVFVLDPGIRFCTVHDQYRSESDAQYENENIQSFAPYLGCVIELCRTLNISAEMIIGEYRRFSFSADIEL